MGQIYKYIRIERELCIGAASCVAVYPEVFDLDAENKAVMKKKDGGRTSEQTDVLMLNVENIDDDQLLLAAQSCPTAAIYLLDQDKNQIYPENV